MHKSIELQNDTTEFFQRLLERLETEGTHVTHFTTCAANTKAQIPTQNCLGSVGLDAQVGAALLPRAQAKRVVQWVLVQKYKYWRKTASQVSASTLKSVQRCFRARMLTQRVSAECEHAKPRSCGPYEKAINVGVAGMQFKMSSKMSAGAKVQILTQINVGVAGMHFKMSKMRSKMSASANVQILTQEWRRRHAQPGKGPRCARQGA
jgi:hypothetical protein